MLESIARVILDAANEGLLQGAGIVESRAKQLAPVRQVFASDGWGIHAKSRAELRSDLHQLGTEASLFTTRPRETWGTTRMQATPLRHWRERRVGVMEALLEDYEMGDRSMLSRRGAYETRTQRARFSTWSHAHIGGRLRGEIRVANASRTGSRSEVWVISPTSYARYQEFGTRHNAAHPFLRPAAEESRGQVVRLIADAVRAASRTEAASGLEIVVRI